MPELPVDERIKTFEEACGKVIKDTSEAYKIRRHFEEQHYCKWGFRGLECERLLWRLSGWAQSLVGLANAYSIP